VPKILPATNGLAYRVVGDGGKSYDTGSGWRATGSSLDLGRFVQIFHQLAFSSIFYGYRRGGENVVAVAAALDVRFRRNRTVVERRHWDTRLLLL